MKTSLILLFALMLTGLSAQSEKATPEKIKIAREAIEINGTMANIRKLYDSRMVKYNEITDRYLAKATDQKAAKKVKESIFKAIGEEMNWESLQEDAVKIYLENFTLEDLKGIVAFYNSPLGQKILAANPAINRQLSEEFTTRSREVDRRAKEILSKAIPQQQPTEAQIRPLARIPGPGQAQSAPAAPQVQPAAK